MFDFLKMMQILLKAEHAALFKLYCTYSNYNRRHKRKQHRTFSLKRNIIMAFTNDLNLLLKRQLIQNILSKTCIPAIR